ncbi:hypothetical protein 162285234 [Organic Lake phycodnavirus 1]|nr:hypothetical protein 162285234 [Organic Lake phycodnavirus 1]
MTIQLSNVNPPRVTSEPQPVLKQDLTSIFGFITLIGPFFIMFMLVSLSIFNSNFKGFFYLIGASLLFVMVNVLNSTNTNNQTTNPVFCNLFASSVGFTVPSFNSSLYIFTLTYLMVPMISYNMFNIPLVLFFVFMFSLDTITRTTYISCTDVRGVLLGSLIGFVWGIVYYFILSQNESTKVFLYYNDFESSRTACMKPSAQKFVCSVNKNAVLS